MDTPSETVRLADQLITAHRRISELEDRIRQHRQYRTRNNDFNIADQILWDIVREENNDNDND